MGSDSGKDSGQEKSGPSFFDNLAEDLGNVLSGNVTSPHSAYDVRNADAMAKNSHGQKEDYLPGGKYGPGSGSYSPSEFHNAGIEKQDGLGSKSPDNAQNATDVSGPSRAVQSLLKEDALTGLSTPSLSPTIDDSVGPLGLNKTKDVSKVQAALVDEGDLDEQTGYIGTKTLDATKAFQDKKGLKVDGQINPGGPTERALLGARSEIASPYSRAPAGTPSIEQQTKTWAESQHRQQQAKQAPPSGYFSMNGVTFTDNWANDLIGGKAATATPKDGLLERTQDQKAADVGEPGMASKASTTPTPSTPSAPQAAKAPKAQQPHNRGRKGTAQVKEVGSINLLGRSTFAPLSHTVTDLATGIAVGGEKVADWLGLDYAVDWGAVNNLHNWADNLVKEDERKQTTAMIGSAVGNIGSAALSTAGLGSIGLTSTIGGSLTQGHRQGWSTKEQLKDLSYSLGRDFLGGRLGSTTGLLGKQTDWLSSNTFMSKMAAKALEEAVSSGFAKGMDLLAEKDKTKQTKVPGRK